MSLVQASPSRALLPGPHGRDFCSTSVNLTHFRQTVNGGRRWSESVTVRKGSSGAWGLGEVEAAARRRAVKALGLVAGRNVTEAQEGIVRVENKFCRLVSLTERSRRNGRTPLRRSGLATSIDGAANSNSGSTFTEAFVGGKSFLVSTCGRSRRRAEGRSSQHGGYGRVYARSEKWGIKSRKVKLGLLYKLSQFGRGPGNGSNGNGWGGAGGGGGGGGGGGSSHDGNFPTPDEGGLNFFSSLFSLLRHRVNSGLLVWAASAFLAGFFVSSLDLKHSAHAKSFSRPRMLADGTNGNNGGEDKGMVVADRGEDQTNGLSGAVWEVRGGEWKRYLIDLEEDEFLFDVVKRNEEEAQSYEHSFEKDEERKEHKEEVQRKRSLGWRLKGKSVEETLQNASVWCSELIKQVFLPAGFPGSVTEDYLEFTSWRMAQIIASQISGVLTTQALLYAVGLGKGAIPTAAAVNWVLRDGIGYLSKIMLSKYGRHFDVHPKGWRLVSDIIENASYGLELLTPVVPHLFVYLAAAAGAGRSAAGLIQAATKSCFNANMAAQRNFAEIIAKGEAQGMASKSVGIGLGILISGCVGSSGPSLVVTFSAVSALHIFFNLKSYQAVQLRTLNPYRASLVLAQFLESGKVPTVKDVNAAEPIFFGFPWFVSEQNQERSFGSLSTEVKRIASAIEKNVELGASLGSVVRTKGEAEALVALYDRDQYLLARQGDHMKVVLKEAASPRDLLRAMVQLVYLYNYTKEKGVPSTGIVKDCGRDGILRVTHDLMEKNFEKIARVLAEGGWVSDGLVARPAANRILENNTQTLQQLSDAKA